MPSLLRPRRTWIRSILVTLVVVTDSWWRANAFSQQPLSLSFWQPSAVRCVRTSTQQTPSRTTAFATVVVATPLPNSPSDVTSSTSKTTTHSSQPQESLPKDDLLAKFDLKRIQRGQQFFQDHSVAISMTWYMALIASFGTPEPAQALLQTGQSDTAIKAELRYMQRTIPALLSWHSEDWTDPQSRARQYLDVVNQKHRQAAWSLERQHQPTNENINSSSKCPFQHITKRLSFSSQRQTTSFPQPPRQRQSLQTNRDGDLLMGGDCGAFGQEHMAATQMSFVAGAILASQGNRKDQVVAIDNNDDLRDFVYLWYVLGNLLGVPEESNHCISLEQATIAVQDLMDNFSLNLGVALQSQDPCFETLTSAFVNGSNQHLPVPVSIPVALALTIQGLGLNVPSGVIGKNRHGSDIGESLCSWKDKILFQLFRSILLTVSRLPVQARRHIHRLQVQLFLP